MSNKVINKINYCLLSPYFIRERTLLKVTPIFFFFAEFDKLILKLIWKCKGPRKDKNDLAKMKSKVEGLMFPDFKTHYKAIVIKRVRYWHKVRHLGQ